jgi:hypothetical protein
MMVDFFIAQNNKFYIIINKLFKTVKTDYDIVVKNKNIQIWRIQWCFKSLSDDYGMKWYT